MCECERGCLTPAEAAAVVQAEREACAKHVESVHQWDGHDDYCDSCKSGAIYPDREDVAKAIRARGDTSALDAALAQARREGMEAAARIVDARFSTMPGIAAAIRSAAGEDGQ